MGSQKSRAQLQQEVEQLRQELLYQQHRRYLDLQRALDRQLDQLRVRKVVLRGERYDTLLPIVQTVTGFDGVTVFVRGKK